MRCHNTPLPCNLCLVADILLLHGLGVKLVIVCGAATLVSTMRNAQRACRAKRDGTALHTGALSERLP